MSDSIVIIGGPHDGERVSAELAKGRPVLWMRVSYPMYDDFRAFVDADPSSFQDEIVHYREMEFADGRTVFKAWVHGSVASPMLELLDGYRKATP